MKIAILAGLSHFTPIYSVANIIRTQCKYFLENDFEFTIFVNENFNINSIPSFLEKIEVKSVLPQIENFKNWTVDDEMSDMILRIETLLSEHLEDYNVCITHDLLLLPMYIPLNIAIRKFSTNSLDRKWFHRIHSKPDIMMFDSPMYNYINSYPLKNSYITYPNHSDSDEVCSFFKIESNQFINVYNTIDLDIYLNQSSRIKTIIQKYETIHDFIILYPTRLNYSKRIDKILDLVKYLKVKGLNPLFIVCNTYNNDKMAKSLLQYYTTLNNLNKIDSNIIFTSELGFKEGLDNDEVKNLFFYSSFFIFPTLTETCPLVLLEAMLNSNILILNKKLECLNEVANDDAYYIDFDNNLWLEECYKVIIYEINSNKILKAKNKAIKEFTTRNIYNKIGTYLKELI
jgi:glycosyltransferase involved in cell wall biosynthesis